MVVSALEGATIASNFSEGLVFITKFNKVLFNFIDVGLTGVSGGSTGVCESSDHFAYKVKFDVGTYFSPDFPM